MGMNIGITDYTLGIITTDKNMKIACGCPIIYADDNKDLLCLIAEALLKYETITAEEIDFLVKYNWLDAYDAYKKQSELLAKAKQETPTQVVEEKVNNNESEN